MSVQHIYWKPHLIQVYKNKMPFPVLRVSSPRHLKTPSIFTSLGGLLYGQGDDVSLDKFRWLGSTRGSDITSDPEAISSQSAVATCPGKENCVFWKFNIISSVSDKYLIWSGLHFESSVSITMPSSYSIIIYILYLYICFHPHQFICGHSCSFQTPTCIAISTA